LDSTETTDLREFCTEENLRRHRITLIPEDKVDDERLFKINFIGSPDKGLKMIYYNVTMGRFLLEIRVFNINEKNFEGPYKIIGSGAFGAIIKKEMKNMKSVAKVQNFDNYEANAEDIYFFIKEVCFYKIMSLFHAGPRFFTELDCDLICYD
jgi:hypothetical protein